MVILPFVIGFIISPLIPESLYKQLMDPWKNSSVAPKLDATNCLWKIRPIHSLKFRVTKGRGVIFIALLGGGNSNMFYFHPDSCRNDSI